MYDMFSQRRVYSKGARALVRQLLGHLSKAKTYAAKYYYPAVITYMAQ